MKVDAFVFLKEIVSCRKKKLFELLFGVVRIVSNISGVIGIKLPTPKPKP